MSELINNSGQRMEDLADLCRGLIRGGKGKSLVEKHQAIIQSVTPEETMAAIDRLLLEGFSQEEVKAGIGKIINIFYKSLQAFSWNKPGEGHFLYYLMQENAGARKLMDELKEAAKVFFHGDGDPAAASATMRQLAEQLKGYEIHYSKKENILFPYIERIFPQYRCLQIMWAFHDDFRDSIQKLTSLLASAPVPAESLNKELGRLFFVVLPIIFREEQIVYPVALKAIPANEWDKMMAQSFEFGWCYMEPPRQPEGMTAGHYQHYDGIDLGTGTLLPEQIKLLLNTLPVDVTYIDEKDEVRYFSAGKERIFPRVPAIIGRKVQNCHPAESVHVVNEIIRAFRSGEKEHADFRIRMRDRYLHIRYFAVRSESGEYRGTLEFSQDITEINQLQGEQRLLDWIS